MRDLNRIPRITQKLEQIWKLEGPDLRFGQLLFNLSAAYDLYPIVTSQNGKLSHPLVHLWAKDDDEIEKVLDKIIEEIKK